MQIIILSIDYSIHFVVFLLKALYKYITNSKIVSILLLTNNFRKCIIKETKQLYVI